MAPEEVQTKCKKAQKEIQSAIQVQKNTIREKTEGRRRPKLMYGKCDRLVRSHKARALSVIIVTSIFGTLPLQGRSGSRGPTNSALESISNLYFA